MKKLMTKQEYINWRMNNVKDIMTGLFLNKKQAVKGYANYKRNFSEKE